MEALALDKPAKTSPLGLATAGFISALISVSFKGHEMFLSAAIFGAMVGLYLGVFGDLRSFARFIAFIIICVIANLGFSENRMFERQTYPLRTLRKYAKCDRYWQKGVIGLDVGPKEPFKAPFGRICRSDSANPRIRSESVALFRSDTRERYRLPHQPVLRTASSN
jgi:hypothetical protein